MGYFKNENYFIQIPSTLKLKYHSKENTGTFHLAWHKTQLRKHLGDAELSVNKDQWITFRERLGTSDPSCKMFTLVAQLGLQSQAEPV